MKPECITKVRAAAGGRTISDAKLRMIEEQISGKMRELARLDPQKWQAMSRDERMTAAADAAMKDIQAEAQLKVFRAELQVVKMAETNERIAQIQRTYSGTTRSQALGRDAQLTENRIQAIRTEAINSLDDMIEAIASRDGTGVTRRALMAIFDVDNPAQTRDVVAEIFKNADGHTGNQAARKAAQAWLDTSEGMRQRFNAAGGNVGKLGYGYLSQAHDQMRVLGNGGAADKAKWVDTTLPLLDRKQYLNDDGTLMADAQVRQVLESAWVTISENGANKTEPGAFRGSGMRANRGNESRVLHFKDGDSWIAYMKEYGEGSLYDAMMGHVGKMARDIGLVEQYGPNAKQTFDVQADIARRADGAGTMANRSGGIKPETYWELISGNAGMPENRTIAAWGTNLRNVQTAAKITAGPLAAFGDMATIATTLHYNRLPYFEMISNVRKQFSAEHREFLQSHGVIAESLANDIHRFVGDHMRNNWSGRMTNAVMKASLLNAWTDGLRAAFAGTMMQNFAKKLGTAWKDLDGWDRLLMERKGITEADWDIITKAAPTERNGVKYLTADGIKAAGSADAATKWLAFVNDEAQFAVVNPDLAARGIVTGGGMRAGTISGEAVRSVAQFKSFPISMVTRHWRRILDTPQGIDGAPLGFAGQSGAQELAGKIGALAALMVTATLLGAIQTQGRHVMVGKDPVDMTGEHAAKFWAKAFAAGGGSGFFGDVLLAPLDDPSMSFEGKFGLLGPVAGAAAGLIDIAKSNEPDARAVKWVNDQLPGVDIWYLRGLWEHAVLHNAQEMTNPGYLARMQRRAQKDWGQDFWWAPGELTPDRAPDFGAAVEEMAR